jgi:hypothetical protein
LQDFSNCISLTSVSFPASLVVIRERAFRYCENLREVTFAADSKLQYIGEQAFLGCPLNRILLPASVTEVHPTAFSPWDWPIVKFDGLPLLIVKGDFVCSLDSKTILKCVRRTDKVEVPAHIEVIGKMGAD